MQIVSRKLIHDFIRTYPDGKGSIEAWFHEAKIAEWTTSMDIKRRYASASFLSKNYVIFNIKGNNYRLVTQVAYNTGVVYVKWAGTHAEYDKLRFP
jgi:mRNA interferase HigB